ncbi:MAG: hypothetical protein M1834_002473 [Cirrosporium novae-zelandiae]|nr:MAG: hypothetical protein M1834_002473 [Cirrosporium novae-zelandiae]
MLAVAERVLIRLKSLRSNNENYFFLDVDHEGRAKVAEELLNLAKCMLKDCQRRGEKTSNQPDDLKFHFKRTLAGFKGSASVPVDLANFEDLYYALCGKVKAQLGEVDIRLSPQFKTFHTVAFKRSDRHTRRSVEITFEEYKASLEEKEKALYSDDIIIPLDEAILDKKIIAAKKKADDISQLDGFVPNGSGPEHDALLRDFLLHRSQQCWVDDITGLRDMTCHSSGMIFGELSERYRDIAEAELQQWVDTQRAHTYKILTAFEERNVLRQTQDNSLQRGLQAAFKSANARKANQAAAKPNDMDDINMDSNSAEHEKRQNPFQGPLAALAEGALARQALYKAINATEESSRRADEYKNIKDEDIEMQDSDMSDVSDMDHDSMRESINFDETFSQGGSEDEDYEDEDYEDDDFYECFCEDSNPPCLCLDLCLADPDQSCLCRTNPAYVLALEKSIGHTSKMYDLGKEADLIQGVVHRDTLPPLTDILAARADNNTPQTPPSDKLVHDIQQHLACMGSDSNKTTLGNNQDYRFSGELLEATKYSPYGSSPHRARRAHEVPVEPNRIRRDLQPDICSPLFRNERGLNNYAIAERYFLNREEMIMEAQGSSEKARDAELDKSFEGWHAGQMNSFQPTIGSIASTQSTDNLFSQPLKRSTNEKRQTAFNTQPDYQSQQLSRSEDREYARRSSAISKASTSSSSGLFAVPMKKGEHGPSQPPNQSADMNIPASFSNGSFALPLKSVHQAQQRRYQPVDGSYLTPYSFGQAAMNMDEGYQSQRSREGSVAPHYQSTVKSVSSRPSSNGSIGPASRPFNNGPFEMYPNRSQRATQIVTPEGTWNFQPHHMGAIPSTPYNHGPFAMPSMPMGNNPYSIPRASSTSNDFFAMPSYLGPRPASYKPPPSPMGNPYEGISPAALKKLQAELGQSISASDEMWEQMQQEEKMRRGSVMSRFMSRISLNPNKGSNSAFYS